MKKLAFLLFLRALFVYAGQTVLRFSVFGREASRCRRLGKRPAMSIAQDEIAGQIRIIKREWKETVDSLAEIALGTQVRVSRRPAHAHTPCCAPALTVCLSCCC